MNAEPLAYADDAPCDKCGHRSDEHVPPLGCVHDYEAHGDGVKFDCECGEFEPGYAEASDDNERCGAWR